MDDVTLRTCAECGMVLDRPGEFHPYVFCVAKKAGRDPWEVAHNLGYGPDPARRPRPRIDEMSMAQKDEIMHAMEIDARV